MEKRECSEPIKHIIIDNFINPENVRRFNDDIQKNAGNWIVYCNDDEKKTTSNDEVSFGSSTKSLINYMQSASFICLLQDWFMIEKLQSDPYLHGGGIHRSGQGGLLSVHLDYAKHPKLPHLERRLNAILYLTPEWKKEWGGATVFTKPDGVTALSRVYPKPGRLLVFETNDISYHGMEAVNCPDGVERVSLATYYLAPIREGVTRERALFVPNRSK